MKTCLILAYDFPPYSSIGAQRPESWLKYFAEFGIYPVVITRHWDRAMDEPLDYFRPSLSDETVTEETEKGTVIKVPYIPNARDRHILKHGLAKYSLLRRLLSLFYFLFKFYSFKFDNTANLYREAGKYLAKNQCDAIIATGEPFILFRYASLLSSEFNIPWIADYRDCWSTDTSDFSEPTLNKWFFELFHKRLEKNTVSTCEFITTAAPAYKESLSKLFPDKPIHIIYNGYDNETFNNLEKADQRKDVFEIAYAGTIYLNQNLEMFLEGFRLFIEDQPDANIILKFYGLDFYPHQKNRLLSYDYSLQPYIATTKKMKYRDVIHVMQKAHLLLLLSKKDANKLRAKIFDYLALDRKILLVENDHNILESILDECKGGVKCDSAIELSMFLKKFYLEFLQSGNLSHQSCNHRIYSRRFQSENLIKKLNTIIYK